MIPVEKLGRRFGLNAAAYGYGPVVTLIVQIVQVPLFLGFWGVERYGEWLVLSGIPMMFVLADAGVAQASASKCIMEVGGRHFAEARNTLRTARIYTTVASSLVVIFALLLTGVIDWVSLLKLTTISPNSAGLVFLLLACYAAITLQGGYLGAWLRSSDHTPVYAFSEGSTRLVDLLALGLVLLLGGGFVAAASALLVSAAICRLTQGWLARKLSSRELKTSGEATWQEFRSVFKPSLAFIGITLTQAVTVQGGIQVLNQIANQQTVVLFNTVRIMVRTMVLLAGAVNSALRPELSRLVGAGKEVVAATFVKRVTIATSAAGGLCYAVFVVAGPHVIDFWTNGKVDPSRVVIAMVGVHALLHILWLVPASISMATNRHMRYASVYAASAVASLCLWILGRDLFGPLLGASLLLALPEGAAVLIAFASLRQSLPRSVGDTRLVREVLSTK